MSTKRIDPKQFIGQRFGRLIVRAIVSGTASCTARIQALCDCGEKHEGLLKSLRDGKTLSCGCLHSDEVRARKTIHGFKRRGQIASQLYTAWQNMKRRCYNPKLRDYHNYGGRGITVCAEWLNNFTAFAHDMGEPPTPQHTVERQDVNGNYNKDNCIWLPQAEQQRNQRKTILSLEKAREIRRLRSQGFGPVEISRQTKIPVHNVGSVIYANCWQDAA